MILPGATGGTGAATARRLAGEGAAVADAIAYIVTRERRVAVNEILVRPIEQTW